MKRLFLALIFLTQFTFSAAAMEFIAGVKGGYFEWKPYIQDMKGSGIEDIETGSGALYGPVFSLLITRELSLSVAALYGNQSAFWSNNNDYKQFGPQYVTATGTYYADITRLDIDSALSYAIFDNFKLIAGYKYQKIECDISLTVVTIDSTYNYSSTLYEDVLVKTPSQGPAFGFGYTLPVGSNIFCAINLTGLYMWGSYELAEDLFRQYRPVDDNLIADPDQDMAEGLPSWKIRQYGFNMEPTFGANIQEHLIMTLGLRLQLMRVQFVDKPEVGGGGGGDTVQIAPDGWMNDYLYGVFASILYMF